MVPFSQFCLSASVLLCAWPLVAEQLRLPVDGGSGLSAIYFGSSPAPRQFTFRSGPEAENLSFFQISELHGAWSLTPNAIRYSRGPGTLQSDSITGRFHEIGGAYGEDFEIKLRLTPVSGWDGHWVRTGILVNGDQPGDEGYAAVLQNLGDGTTTEIRIRRGLDGHTLAAGSWPGFSRAAIHGHEFVLTLAGSYASGRLELTFTVSGPGSNGTVSRSLHVDTAAGQTVAPYPGPWAGFGHRLNAGASVDYHGLTVSRKNPAPAPAPLTGFNISRVDPVVAFDWSNPAAPPDLLPGFHSARWAGKIRTEEGGVYTFHTDTAEPIRLWIDGELLVDHWAFPPPAQIAASISLGGSRTYPIVLEIKRENEDAALRLLWQKPGSETSTVIPTENLLAEVRRFPSDSHVIDVTRPPYNAVGDGIADDWWAIQRAISDNAGNAEGVSNVIYLPNGTYRVSRTLEWRTYNQSREPTGTNGGWRSYITLQGQNRGNAIVRLADNTFTSPPSEAGNENFSPNAVLYTASSMWLAPSEDRIIHGGSNEAFQNNIFDLTVHTGRGNPGAVGISYQGSNQASIRNVSIISGDGTGFAALRSTRRDNGPAMLRDIHTNGFDYGYYGQQNYSVFTLEDVTLRDARVAALRSSGQSLSINRLQTFTSSPAILVDSALTHIALLNAELNGPGSGGVGIDNPHRGALFLRDLGMSGFAAAVRNGSSIVNGKQITEFVSHPPVAAHPRTTLRSLRLPERPFIDYYNHDIENDWAFVGAPSGTDDTAAIQAALDSGKPVVYFQSFRKYRVRDTLRVPPSVRHIVGLDAEIWPASGDMFSDPANPRAVFRIEGETPEPLLLEMIRSRFANRPGAVFFENRSDRDLMVRHFSGMAAGELHVAHPGAGSLFLEDAATTRLRIRPGENVWARQFNPEGEDAPKVKNDGGALWILGLKIEGRSVILETIDGGESEVLGGALYPARNNMSERTAFQVRDAAATFSYATIAFPPSQEDFGIHLEDTRGDDSGRVRATGLPSRGAGRHAALLSAWVSRTHSLDAWRERNFTPAELAKTEISAYGAAPAHDNIPNLIKYHLGLGAWDFTSTVFTIEPAGDNGTFHAEFRRAIDAPGADVRVEWSENLKEWHEANLTKTVTARCREHENVRITIDAPGADRLFIRLRGILP